MLCGWGMGTMWKCIHIRQYVSIRYTCTMCIYLYLFTYLHADRTSYSHTYRSTTLVFSIRQSMSSIAGWTRRSHWENSWRRMVLMAPKMQSFDSEFSTMWQTSPNSSLRSLGKKFSKGQLKFFFMSTIKPVLQQYIILVAIYLCVHVYVHVVVLHM